MPLPKIERRVMPFMGGADYLGPELNGDTYRLKFMRGRPRDLGRRRRRDGPHHRQVEADPSSPRD